MAAVAAIFFFAAVIVAEWLWHRARKRQEPLSRKRRVVLALAAVGMLCIPYGYFIEPYWPEVTHVTVTSAKLRKGTQVRIVHISDVHSDPQPRLEQKLPRIIAEQKPDLIVFTGDSANHPNNAPLFQELMRNLAAIAPTYVVRGNWDPPGSSERLFGHTGVRELEGKPESIIVRDSSIVISGDSTESMETVSSAFLLVPPHAVRIYLHHFPDRIYEVARENVDLYLAGHTHGGQVALPLYGALITFSKYDKQFEHGLYKIQNTWLYVNRGIGMEGSRAPRVRFWSRPEITVIDLLPAD
jgi:uncharacterized protein